MPAMSPSREDIIHSAMIRAALCSARGLSESQACHPPGVLAAYAGTHRPAASCDQAAAPVCAPADSARCEFCAEPVKPCECCAKDKP